MFELDGKVVVLASLQYDGVWQGTSTSWWVGDVDEKGTRFLPGGAHSQGLVDYGPYPYTLYTSLTYTDTLHIKHQIL